MGNVEALLNFIKYNPPYDEYWYEKDWEENLSAKIPEWINLVTNETLWHRIEKVYPRSSYTELCKLFCHVNNYKFIIRWFFSPIGYHREAAKNWLKNIDNITTEVWTNLPDDIKIFVVYYFFNSLLKDKIQNYSLFLDTVNRFNENSRDYETKKIFEFLTESFNIYLNTSSKSVDLFYLRLVLEKSKDEKYLKLFNEMEENIKINFLPVKHNI